MNTTSKQQPSKQPTADAASTSTPPETGSTPRTRSKRRDTPPSQPRPGPPTHEPKPCDVVDGDEALGRVRLGLERLLEGIPTAQAANAAAEIELARTLADLMDAPLGGRGVSGSVGGTAKAQVSLQYRETLARVRELAPPAKETTSLDRLRTRRQHAAGRNHSTRAARAGGGDVA